MAVAPAVATHHRNASSTSVGLAYSDSSALAAEPRDSPLRLAWRSLSAASITTQLDTLRVAWRSISRSAAPDQHPGHYLSSAQPMTARLSYLLLACSLWDLPGDAQQGGLS